jgi:hypothetical protein
MTRVFVSRGHGIAEAWLKLSAMQGDEVQKQIAEAKALYQRTDELGGSACPAITRRCRRRGAAANRVHPGQHRRVFRVNGRMRTLTALQWQSSKR